MARLKPCRTTWSSVEYRGILPRRALSGGRVTCLGATLDLHRGLLAISATSCSRTPCYRRRNYGVSLGQGVTAAGSWRGHNRVMCRLAPTGRILRQTYAADLHRELPE